jgi:hypothetical protein
MDLFQPCLEGSRRNPYIYARPQQGSDHDGACSDHDIVADLDPRTDGGARPDQAAGAHFDIAAQGRAGRERPRGAVERGARARRSRLRVALARATRRGPARVAQRTDPRQPLRAGHVGGPAGPGSSPRLGAGLAYRYEDSIAGGNGSTEAYAGGGQLQLDINTRLALTARFGVTKAHEERMTDVIFGLAVY